MPQLDWDWGTAYDLFVSLQVLHEPADFGVRGAWAAGVRARLPAAEREMLEQAQSVVGVPLHWIYRLSKPKEALGVLRSMSQIPAAERLPILAFYPGRCSEGCELLREVAARGRWSGHDMEALRQFYHSKEPGKGPTSEELTNVLGWWARVEEFGDRYLEALQAYQEVFFGEEEKRIRTALEKALDRGQELARRLALPDLIEELSQGLRFSELPDVPGLVLAPSYWITPLVLFGEVEEGRVMWLFGARPADASLVPGEMVPDVMLRALKALSDPTRLRILHYLGLEPRTPAELARLLRLRLPTVMHHLKTLRLAGLVQLILDEGREINRYAARREAVATTFATLEGFLGPGEIERSEAETSS